MLFRNRRTAPQISNPESISTKSPDNKNKLITTPTQDFTLHRTSQWERAISFTDSSSPPLTLTRHRLVETQWKLTSQDNDQEVCHAVIQKNTSNYRIYGFAPMTGVQKTSVSLRYDNGQALYLWGTVAAVPSRSVTTSSSHEEPPRVGPFPRIWKRGSPSCTKEYDYTLGLITGPQYQIERATNRGVLRSTPCFRVYRVDPVSSTASILDSSSTISDQQYVATYVQRPHSKTWECTNPVSITSSTEQYALLCLAAILEEEEHSRALTETSN